MGENRGTITASYTTGSATSTGVDRSFLAGDVGGLVGWNTGLITASYATGNVYSSGGWCVEYVGAGFCDSTKRYYDGAGGLVGDNQGTITMSFATGRVSGAGRTSVGGLAGQTSDTASLSYWDTQTTGQTRSSGGVGRPTVQLQSPTGNTGIYANWNPNWWDFGTASQYPVLKVDGLSVATQRGTTPTNLTATPGPNPGEVTLSWRSDTHAPAYYVAWGKEDGGWELKTIPGDASGYTITNLEPGQKYDFTVAAFGSWGRGPWSPNVSATAAQASSVSAVTDRAALVALYKATGGTNNQWVMNDGWLSDAPLGQWYGVATNTAGRVTALELDYNTLSGSIPAELGNLDQLTILRMGSNQLTGPIPSELGRLSNLSILGLANNQLTGSIPPELGNLSGLTRVSMWNNQLSSPIPSEFGNLFRLTKLSLGSNQLSGSIPASLGNLSNLESLGLQRNQLSGPIPATLGGLTNLTWLDIDFNELSGSISPQLGNLSKLTVLRMGSNQLSGPMPPSLGNLSNLSTLGLGNNQLTGSIPPQLGSLASLTRFSLWNNQVSGAIPPQLGNLSNLIRLSLGSNQLSGTIPSQLGNLTRLQHLYLQSNQLTGAIPSQLGSLSNLNNLDLSSNRLSGGVPTTLGNLAGLKLLRLSNNQLTGAIPSQLGNLSGLTRLCLYENRLSGTIPAELARLTKLEVLDLSHNSVGGAIPDALFGSSATAGSGFRGNGAVSAETAFATNIVYPNPDFQPIRETRPQPAFLSSLQILNLSHNHLIGVVPPGLSRLANLQRSYFHENQNLAPRPNHKMTKSGEEVACTAEMEAEGGENDLNALAKLYELTDGRGKINFPIKGPQWYKSKGWENFFKGRPTEPLNEWHGVTINDGRVIRLNLNGNNLQENNGVTHWATHLISLNENAWGCKYPLYWLEELDLGDNKLHGDIGRLLSALRLQPGVTLKVDLSGANNRWNPDHVDDVDYKNITVLRSPDLSAVADKLKEEYNRIETEEDESLSIATTEIANLGLAVLSDTAGSQTGRLIGRIGSSVGGKVGFINAATGHEAVTNVAVGIILKKENEELQRTFLDLIGITSGPVRNNIIHRCLLTGEVWDSIRGTCVLPICEKAGNVVGCPP